MIMLGSIVAAMLLGPASRQAKARWFASEFNFNQE
jgi:hypothetical protein